MGKILNLKRSAKGEEDVRDLPRPSLTWTSRAAWIPLITAGGGRGGEAARGLLDHHQVLANENETSKESRAGKGGSESC